MYYGLKRDQRLFSAKPATNYNVSHPRWRDARDSGHCGLTPRTSLVKMVCGKFVIERTCGGKFVPILLALVLLLQAAPASLEQDEVIPHHE